MVHTVSNMTDLSFSDQLSAVVYKSHTFLFMFCFICLIALHLLKDLNIEATGHFSDCRKTRYIIHKTVIPAGKSDVTDLLVMFLAV